jgi:hypothetical protein
MIRALDEIPDDAPLFLCDDSQWLEIFEVRLQSELIDNNPHTDAYHGLHASFLVIHSNVR